MQTLTFTQKLLRQRRFLSSLIPLLALFVGLGASQTALAQTASSVLSDNVTLIRKQSAVTNTTTYDTQTTNSAGTPVPPATAIFNQTNFGIFDLSVADAFTINSAVLTIDQAAGETFDAANLRVRIFEGTLASTTTASNPGFANIPLTPDIVPAGFAGTRNYTLSNAGRNILASLLGGTSPGKTYRFDVRLVATDGGNLYTIASPIVNSVFTVVGVAPAPDGVTFSNQTVIVDQGAGSVTRPASTFNGAVLIDQKTGSTTTPAFDINNGQLILKGGSITTTATGTSVVSGVNLNYRILSPSPSFAVVAVGMLQLNPSAPVSGGVRTFEMSTGTDKVIVPIQNPGNGYILSISYQASYQNGSSFPTTATDNGPTNQGYNATFDVTGTKTPPPTVQANTILIAPNGGADVTFYFNSASSPQFSGADLSSPANGGTTYNVNNGQLLLNNTTVTTTSPDVVNVVLYYRTRLSTSTGGAYQALTLTQNSGSVTSDVKTFSLNPATASQPNLIATPAVISAGTYSVDVYYQANGTRNGTPFSIVDPPTGFYSASFTVVGTPIAQTIWTGGKNDNWFDVDNWSAGIPTATTNALVRDLGAGTQAPYPNIYAGVVARTTGGAFLYDNTAYPFAAARNLILGGTSQANRSIARLIVGRLKVYGDFTNTFASFIQRENTVVEFAGTDVPNVNGANQVITNGGFAAVEIGGTGNKDLTGLMEVSKSITFTGGILRTNISDPGGSLVILADRSPINNMNGAQLLGETDATYLRGFAKTTRQGVLVGETRTYGNMGMTLTFTGTNSPGNMEVTRNTVEAYAPVSGRFGIRRIFGVRPGDQTTNTAGLSADMVFRYRTSETMDLNGVNTRTPGTGSIPEPNLLIFVSSNAGGNFGIVGRDGPVDLVNKEVSKMGVRSFATFTLGDSENPLPVRLTAFDAKRVGTDALVTWETASELNSRGYEVQISTTGKEFRTLASVASAAPNTNRTTQYRYIDTEANKSGTRYYRLRQIDLDGKEAFFNPVAVSFTGKAIETALVAYPNPLNGNEQLHLTFQSANAGKGQISITDMTGRMVRQQPIDVTTGTSDLTVEKLGDLKMGMYLVRLTLPSGQVQNLKVVKQ